MTMPEEAGKAVAHTVDALRGSPALLALILLQMITMGMIAYNARSLGANQHEREMLMINRCLEQAEKE